MYYLTVMFPVQNHPDFTAELTTALCRCTSSATVLDKRDCTWKFRTEEEREDALTRLNPILCAHPEVTFDLDEDLPLEAVV